MKKIPTMKEPRTTRKSELEYFTQLEKYFKESKFSTLDKLSNFAKYIPRQDLTGFLYRYEVFKKILDVQGSIVECGVYQGNGLLTFAHFSSILEPINHQRRIIGFDTFSGFTSLSKKDKGSKSTFAHKGGVASDSLNDLKKCISIFDSNRFLNHIPKIELVKGDITKTVPKFLKDNPHTVVSLLYLDVDVYKPTRSALENFVERIPKGGVIAFDELNTKQFVGETIATLETIGIRNLEIKRFPFEPNKCFAIIN